MGSQLTLLQNTDVDLSHNNVDAGHRDPKSCPPGDRNPSKDISVTLADPIFPSLNFYLLIYFLCV